MQIIYRIILLFTIVFTHSISAQDYVISKGDLIDVKVFQHSDLDTSLRVSESGRVNIPLVGGINIQGKTEVEVEAIIEKSLQSGGFINSPQVSVVVTEFNDRTASVLGKVHNPGEFAITTGDSIISVISKAGGLMDDGNPKVTLYRRGQEPQVFNLYSPQASNEFNQNSQIQSGDVLLIAQAEVFYTYGEINNPGEYILRDSMNVMQALSISGGLTSKASNKGLFIIRKDAQGQSESIKAKLDDNVLPSDVILVKESLF